MSYILSVDPGLRKCGAALWRDGVLLRAELVTGAQAIEKSMYLCVEEMTHWVCYWAHASANIQRLEALREDGLTLACEYPRTYGGRAKKGDANDLVGVALVAGAILGRLACPTRLVLPEDWKGSAPKPQSKAEYLRDGYVVEQRSRLKLSAEELLRVQLPGNDWRKALDVWDAVGIGLWALRR